MQRLRLVRSRWLVAGVVVLVLGLATAAWAAEQPRHGGILTYIVSASGFPSMDGHRETTFAVVQPLAPFYSVLIKVNPENPADPTDFVGDVAESWTVSPDGRVYTFKLRRNVKFHDGSLMTSRDVKATFDKIIFPPPGVASARKGMYTMVEAVEAPDDFTVVFRLKFPTAAFLPALANPFNWIYKADILEKDMHWYEKNVLGTGPFKFQEYVAGSHVAGVRNPDYFIPGLPYLDGFRAIFIAKEAPQVAAIRGGRAMVNFRSFPPKIRDDLVRAMGDQIVVQESAWNCALYVVPNHKVKPFDDPRVRRALTLALDRWGAAETISKIAIVKTVGGLVFPHHPLAASREELQQIAGFWPDIEKSRREARRLLREAGVPEGFKFRFHNRGVEQPYKVLGIWLIDQWRQIGLEAEHWVQPTAQFYATLRSRQQQYEVSMDFNCQSVVNPILDITKFLSQDVSSLNHAEYEDRELDALHAQILRETNTEKLKALLRQFEKRVLDEQAHYLITLWWHRIVPHNARMRGWKISPSHYLNQDLATVWLAPE
ncbi:MAG: peptide ABC transporter substrate-binding protein [Candidatus Tectimicrobiota bacterium]|nr:MAG: peptide ABC transporter substrate-binding protein [Candidatus Tectomicrobia bacterium]